MIQTRLKAIGKGLALIEKNTFHYFRPGLKAPFIIWAEDMEQDSLHLDNKKVNQGIHGTIDYFTKKEFDPKVDEIQAYLNSIDWLVWRLNSVQFEEETNLIHHEWEFTVRG